MEECAFTVIWNCEIIFPKPPFYSSSSTRVQQKGILKIFTLESVFEKMHFRRWPFSADTCVDDRPNGGKKLGFETKTDTCGRGPIKVIKTGVKNAEQNLVYGFIQAFRQYISV